MILQLNWRLKSICSEHWELSWVWIMDWAFSDTSRAQFKQRSPLTVEYDSSLLIAWEQSMFTVVHYRWCLVLQHFGWQPRGNFTCKWQQPHLIKKLWWSSAIFFSFWQNSLCTNNLFTAFYLRSLLQKNFSIMPRRYGSGHGRKLIYWTRFLRIKTCMLFTDCLWALTHCKSICPSHTHSADSTIIKDHQHPTGRCNQISGRCELHQIIDRVN